MTTLITGAGLVGSLAAARLIAERAERPVLFDVAFSTPNLADKLSTDAVTLAAGDVTDTAEVVHAIQRHHIDRIIHTAGLLTSTVRERPYTGVRINLTGTLSVFEAARVTGVKRVVFCSSNTVYMGLKTRPPDGMLREDFELKAISEYPPSVYASMKLAAEWLGHSYTNEYGLDVVSVRFGGVFGPWRGVPSGGPSKLLQQLIESCWSGQGARIGSGDLRRSGMDYVYASDAAQGAVRAAFAERPAKRVYNIAMGQLYSVSQIIELLERISGRKLKLDLFEAGTHSGYDQESYPADLSRAQAELGYAVEFPMERAIKDYMSWLERTAVGR